MIVNEVSVYKSLPCLLQFRIAQYTELQPIILQLFLMTDSPEINFTILKKQSCTQCFQGFVLPQKEQGTQLSLWLQAVLNGMITQFSAKIEVPVRLWEIKGGRIQGKRVEADRINSVTTNWIFMRNWVQRFLQIYKNDRLCLGYCGGLLTALFCIGFG